ncbi:hypothetical protein BDY19DRAFT_998414 [Irpex rosettiformis]|uniref:Uncharacterized protein n=1 Tax=Irpex rosettiformis TaxID=378272 RepID=A0ACB8TNR4_9APHY|nr:hypothetical protein BDY19DRAFT_998414 [Irpex rosettiformis]
MGKEARCISQKATLGSLALDVEYDELPTLTEKTDHRITSSCDIVLKLEDVCTILIALAFSLFATFRIYALWNKNLKVFICVLVLGLMYPIGYIYYATCLVRLASPPPITGCLSYSVLPARLTPKAGAETFFRTLLILTLKDSHKYHP